MERYKIFTGIVAWMDGVVDNVMDAINRNFQKFGGFFTSTYGINMQDALDALEVYDPGGPGPITVRAGEAISPLYNVIINDAAESIQTIIDYLFDPPVNDDICYVFVTTKEDYDPTSDATLDFFPSYGAPVDPYYKWNISHEFKVQDNDPSLPDTNAILLAKMTYVSATSSWTIEDKRIQTQFSISFGNTELIYHILSAHTACLYPDGTNALTPSRSGNSVEVVQLQTTYNDYLYSEGQIYRGILSTSISFSGSDDDGWYYIYVDDGDLAKIKVADEYASFPYSTKDYFVIAFVHWTNPTLQDPTDKRTAYFLATNAIDVRNVPAGNIAATNIQSAINELDTEKLAKAGDTMSGDLNMSLNKITNIGDDTTFGNNGAECNVNLAKAGDWLNLAGLIGFYGAPGESDLRSELLDKLKLQSGAEIDASVEDLKVTGGNIQLDTGKTIDGIDAGEVRKLHYDWVVDDYASQDLNFDSWAYMLDNILAGDSVYIKSGLYTIDENYAFPNNVTIRGENAKGVIIACGDMGVGYELTIGNSSNVSNVTFQFVDDVNSKLKLNNRVILSNCFSDQAQDKGSMTIGMYCAISNFRSLSTYSLDLGITSFENKIVNAEFYNVIISNDKNMFSNVKAQDFAVSGAGNHFSCCRAYSNGTGWTLSGGSQAEPNMCVACHGNESLGTYVKYAACSDKDGNDWAP